MPSLSPGDPAPDFTAETDGGGSIQLSELRGRKVVLYFYPRDNTAGCTLEACEFRDTSQGFSAKNAVVLGVSADSMKSHDRFKAKYDLTFPLISDADRKIAEAYGTWREKSLYGRTYMGIVRSTFVIDEEGTVVAIYDKVKPRGHAQALLAAL